MRSKTSGTVFLLAWLLLVAPIFAQMGYPLKGSWSGDWWLKKGEENHLLLDFDWDGKTLTGVLNPGTDNVVLQKLSLEPPTGGVEGAIDPWNLHFEADVKDTSGRTVHYVVDGKLQNIGAYRKFVTGTWMAGNQKGEFRIVRN
ncbi:MAG: hypothetical protein DMG16_24515 [Acidobacteria bacterium]|nr:MAG: hypothetical protein DMG16_24515 [Acidobacteriota bacterium]